MSWALKLFFIFFWILDLENLICGCSGKLHPGQVGRDFNYCQASAAETASQSPFGLVPSIARATWSSRATSKLSYMSMRNADGRLVPLKDRADTIATYLEQQHLSNSNGQGLLPYNDLIGEKPTCDNSLFSLQELHLILKRCKVNKQPGPDQVIVELYRWLNTSNRQFLLDILNEWWAEGLVPHDILDS